MDKNKQSNFIQEEKFNLEFVSEEACMPSFRSGEKLSLWCIINEKGNDVWMG